ncbi:ATP-binding cassette subfamily B protein [Pedobacter sp. UYP30]|uniref:ABC transporter ATP-binding protein n=1 Tax=Pedobacter sp. UYP30 TaxID=1756400 RepID=UPI003391437A
MIGQFTEKVKKFRTNLNLKKTFTLVWTAAKGWMIASIVMILVETVLFLGSLYALKLLVDKISHLNAANPNASSDVIKYVVFAATVSILYGIARAVSTYLIEVQSTKVAHHIDEEIHLKAVSLELSYYENPEYYDILSRAKEAGSDRPNLVITTMLEIAKNLLSLCAIGAIIFSISWFLLPLLVLFLIPTLFVRIFFANKQNVWRIKHTSLERKSSYLSNLITTDISAKEIRAFDLGRYFSNLYNKYKTEVFTTRLKISYSRTWLEMITNSLATVGFFMCIGYISLGAITGRTTVGDILIFLVIFPQSFSLIQYLTSGISILYQNNIFIVSIFELLDLNPPKHNGENLQAITENECFDLEFHNLSFKYPYSKKQTLSNINLKIPKGKIVAVVGLNGAGKSTLIKLLCNLYTPNDGSITLGGKDLKSLNATDYRRYVSPVFQDFSKYNVTIADNIRFGDLKKEYNLQDIKEAAEKSGASEFIDLFPQKYETVMGRIFEDGMEVSIGQWQKIAIARAFFGSAKLLILDEATSALDAIAEKKLLDSFRKNLENRSALVISHRHSAVKHADYIYVLSKGKIVQHGTDKSLLATAGIYSDLFKYAVLNEKP